MIYYSTENLSTETMDRETRDRVLSLSYEKFFNDSVSLENDISYLNKSIEETNKEYAKTAKVLKERYNSMSLEEEDKGAVKTKFFANVKNWFIRIWAAIVTIFEKIVSVIQSLIKTLIIYIKKHTLLKNSIWAKLGKDKNLSVAFSNPDEKTTKMIEKALTGKVKIPVVAFKNNVNDCPKFEDVCETLHNNTLINFMRCKVVIDNKKSAINTEAYDTLVQSIDTINGDDIASKYAADERLTTLSEKVTEFTSESVLYGEADRMGELYSMYGETSDAQTTILNALKNGNVKTAANIIVYNEEQPEKVVVPLIKFLGIEENDGVSLALGKLRKLLADYEYTGNLVIGKGGYCDIIQELLKKYSVAANNDKKHIKNIKDKIIKTMNSIDSDKESGQKVTHRCKRFTNLIVRIQKIKNDFVLLRQSVLANILTAYSSLDRALSAAINPIDPDKLKDKEGEDIENSSRELVGGKDGEDPLDGFYDEDESNILN